MTSKTLTLRSRGTITLPAELRRKYSLEEGEPLTLLDLGGVFTGSATAAETEAKLRVFFDADVLIAGSASKTHSSAVA